MFLNRTASVLSPYFSLPISNARKSMPAYTSGQRRLTMSANETRISLINALASQTYSFSQRGCQLSDLYGSVVCLRLCSRDNDTAIQLLSASVGPIRRNIKAANNIFNDLMVDMRKYLVPRQFEARNLEELLMAVPDLETVNFITLKRTDQYEIREVQPYFVAETTMPGKDGFGFGGASQSFNVLAEYLFGKNKSNTSMEMTTPVITRKSQPNGEKMAMTTPVITRKMESENKWSMSFVMPSKYGSDLPLPKDSSVRIKQVQKKIIAVAAFSGFVTDEEVARRELKLKAAVKNDPQFQIKEGEQLEVSQYNPPFTLPFTRRNEIALEVESKLK